MNILIVDDEYYNVESIRLILEEQRPQFERIFCAYNMRHAMEYLSEHEIGVMICDIEMPGGSGLQLLDEIRKMKLDVSCIFLTAYAKFEYISRAMKLSSSDYLLKPVEEKELLAAIDKAVEQHMQQKQNAINTLRAGYWKESELYLIEIFWQEILNGTIPSVREEIEKILYRRKLEASCLMKDYIFVIIQSMDGEYMDWEKGLHEFAVKNVVREYFYREDEYPVIVRWTEQLFFLPIPAEGRTQHEVVEKCTKALEEFVPYFPNKFNFYIAGKTAPMEEAENVFEELLKLIRKNVSLENYVFDLARTYFEYADVQEKQIPAKNWIDLFLQEKLEVLIVEVSGYLSRLQHGGLVTRESLVKFYYSFLQLLLERLNEEQQHWMYEWISRNSPDEVCSSVQHVKKWVEEILEAYRKCMQETANQSGVVAKVSYYVKTHLYEEMSREMLAAMVYLNPDYLSHIFKRETGKSLTNYIIEERIEEAKRLLVKKDMSIRDIAITCGFQNISYFGRQFKKVTGMTPREFRK